MTIFWPAKYYRPESVNLTFESNWNADEEPESKSDLDASAINLFYIINTMHDITYRVLNDVKNSSDSLKLLETSKQTTLAKVGKKMTQLSETFNHGKVQIMLISNVLPMVKQAKWYM
jgi:hypothetical protein